MAVVEYLLIVQRADTFCDSVDSFNRLVTVDSALAINGGRIRFKDKFECEYAITSGEIEEKKQRFFHLMFTSDSSSQKSLDNFTELLKVIRSIINRIGSQPEILWDDISFHYSRKGYDHIYRIENLMRKLIANFMLVTVGKEWVEETTPREVKEAISKSKRKEFLNALHSIDFIHLADFLLKPYSNKTASEILVAIKHVKTIEELNEIRESLPESNWSRYFSGLVDCEDTYLKKRWEELYELRCAVAHNAIIQKSDLERIEILVSELQTKLEDAIGKLPQVNVPAEEVQQLTENAAKNVSTLVGNFLLYWNDLEMAILNFSSNYRWNKDIRLLGDALYHLQKQHVFSPGEVDRILEIRNLRNQLTHSRGSGVSEDEIRGATKDAAYFMGYLSAYVENSVDN